MQYDTCALASIKKIKLWAKVIPAERVACKILSSNISTAMAAWCVRCLLQTGEIALQNKASTSLMVSISCLMTSSFFSCSWRNFARRKKPSEWKQTSWHRDSAGSWGLKSTCSTFPCSSCMFLRRVSMGASASAKSCWILIWRRKVAKKLDTLLVWIVAERNRTLERNQTLHQKYKFPEGPHWNEKISTSTLHTLQILAMKPPWSCGNSESQWSSCTFFCWSQWHQCFHRVTFMAHTSLAWKKHPCWPKSPCLYLNTPFPGSHPIGLTSPGFPMGFARIFPTKKGPSASLQKALAWLHRSNAA